MAFAKIKYSMVDERVSPEGKIEGEYRHLVYLMSIMICEIASGSQQEVLDVIKDIGYGAVTLDTHIREEQKEEE